MIDSTHVDMAMQYALAISRCLHDDDWKLQDLGPIHLIKYVYLADLGHAQKHGVTYTGAPWRFYHFGPWAAEVYERVEPAMQGIQAEAKQIESRYGDDFTRWHIARHGDAQRLREELEKKLPLVATAAVYRAVKEFGNATPELLHFVYRTQPMLHAAPNETLEFRAVEETPKDSAPASESSKLRPKALKKRQEYIADARRRFAEKASERLRRRAENRAAQPPPRYDEVFDEGTRLLDELAGPPLDVTEGTMEFSDTIWKSPARTGSDDG